MINPEHYNEDELRTPDWMDDQFFVKVLQNCEKAADVQIESFDVTPGTTKCDHYASIMFRAKVHYTLHRNDTPKFQSMIIKTMPMESGQKLETLSDIDIFETEIKMYTETLPKIEKVLRQYGDDTKLCTRSLYHTLTPRKLIVLEDLVQLGYETISNRSSNLDEVRAALLKVAKLHAVSYKLAEEGDHSITSFNSNFFANETLLKETDFTKNAVKLLIETCKKHTDLQEFVPHLARIDDKLFKNFLATYKTYHTAPETKGIFVLNHGDFHMKNMMVRPGIKGVLGDIMLFDYQLSYFGSPAIDILYSTVMLMSADMRRNHRDELIYYYFTNFQQTLRLIEYSGSIPTMTEFQMELIKHKPWELFLVVAFFVLSYVFIDDAGDLSEAIEHESYRRKIFEHPELLQELREILPKLLYRGYFEN